MKVLNIIWMFAVGIVAAVALAVWHGAAGPPVDGAAVDANAGGARAVSGTGAQRPAAPDEGGARPVRPDARRAADAAHGDADTASAEAAPAERAGAAAALLGDLRAMSEGYRNRVFLHAIREQGHYCEGVADTQLGDAEVLVWRVACHGGRAYLIHADAAAELAVEPLYYTDPTVIRAAPVPEDAPLRDPRLPPDNR